MTSEGTEGTPSSHCYQANTAVPAALRGNVYRLSATAVYRVHEKWSLSQRGSESGGAEIGMYVNKCVLVKSILIEICHVESEENQSSFQGKSVVR